MKRIVFPFIFFISLVIITGCATQLRPVTWEIVDEVNRAGGDLRELDYYLSGPLTLTAEPQIVDVQTNTGTLVLFNDRNNSKEITMTTKNKGKMIGYFPDPNNKENFEVLFPDKVITMKFQRNMDTNYYDFVSANSAGRNYLAQSNATAPHLIIKVAYRMGRDSVVQNQNNQVSVTPYTGTQNRNIMEAGFLQKDAMVNFILSNGSTASRSDVDTVIGVYIEEAQIERVNHDLAIAMMCEGTNFLSKPEISVTNNYGDLQRLGNRETVFPDMRTGIRAHIQQIKAYASTDGFSQPVVDRQRLDRVRPNHGKAVTLDDLFPYWETKNPASYKTTINNILNEMYANN